MSALLPARELGGVWGEKVDRITFQKAKEGENSFISWWSWAVILGPCLRPFSFLTRLPALLHSPHSETLGR